MSIIETLNTNQVVDALYNDKENSGFTYEACKALANYYEELSDDLDEPIELDVVAWRCEWSELEEDELIEQYKDEVSNTSIEGIVDYLEGMTTVIKTTSSTYLIGEF